jgi:hypothetical protein
MGLILDETDFYTDSPVSIYTQEYDGKKFNKFVSLTRQVSTAKLFVGMTGSLSKKS